MEFPLIALFQRSCDLFVAPVRMDSSPVASAMFTTAWPRPRRVLCVYEVVATSRMAVLWCSLRCAQPDSPCISPRYQMLRSYQAEVEKEIISLYTRCCQVRKGACATGHIFPCEESHRHKHKQLICITLTTLNSLMKACRRQQRSSD